MHAISVIGTVRIMPRCEHQGVRGQNSPPHRPGAISAHRGGGGRRLPKVLMLHSSSYTNTQTIKAEPRRKKREYCVLLPDPETTPCATARRRSRGPARAAGRAGRRARAREGVRSRGGRRAARSRGGRRTARAAGGRPFGGGAGTRGGLRVRAGRCRPAARALRGRGVSAKTRKGVARAYRARPARGA